MSGLRSVLAKSWLDGWDVAKERLERTRKKEIQLIFNTVNCWLFGLVYCFEGENHSF